jgi:serine/threonine protein phosphatase PrpC
LLVFGNHFACAWAGDSRLYLLRGGGLRQISQDHTEVQELVEQGLLAPEEAKHHPRANVITRAIGSHEALPLDKIQDQIQAGDMLLLCSDGLTKMLSDDEIAAALAADRPIEVSVEMLMQTTLDRGAPDNVTLIAIKVEETPESPA